MGKVCHLWKETIDHLERYKQLWRHICLNDIHRASLIDIIGFNPLSHDYQQGVYGGCEDDFEDLWKNVYKSWRAGQFLGRCKKSSFKLIGCHPMSDMCLSLGRVVQVGPYVYMLNNTICDVGLSVWNIDTSSQVLYYQSLRDKIEPSGECSQIYAHLQNPLCKFSRHQDMTQLSLIIPAIGGLIQWWAFSNGEFQLAKELQVEYYNVRVWHNILVICARNGTMKVFILERTENEFNFRLRNVSEKFPDDVDWRSLNVWDNRFLLEFNSTPFTVAIHGLDDFQRQVIVTGPYGIRNLGNPRIFGDFVLNTIKQCYSKSSRGQWLHVFNIKTGDHFEVEINGGVGNTTKYTLHGDILIADQGRHDKVNICRINSSGHRDPVWCKDNTQGRIDECTVVVPEVFESKKLIEEEYNISYGESIVFLTQQIYYEGLPLGLNVQQYRYVY